MFVKAGGRPFEGGAFLKGRVWRRTEAKIFFGYVAEKGRWKGCSKGGGWRTLTQAAGAGSRGCSARGHSAAWGPSGYGWCQGSIKAQPSFALQQQKAPLGCMQSHRPRSRPPQFPLFPPTAAHVCSADLPAGPAAADAGPERRGTGAHTTVSAGRRVAYLCEGPQRLHDHASGCVVVNARGEWDRVSESLVHVAVHAAPRRSMARVK